MSSRHLCVKFLPVLINEVRVSSDATSKLTGKRIRNVNKVVTLNDIRLLKTPRIKSIMAEFGKATSTCSAEFDALFIPTEDQKLTIANLIMQIQDLRLKMASSKSNIFQGKLTVNHLDQLIGINSSETVTLQKLLLGGIDWFNLTVTLLDKCTTTIKFIPNDAHCHCLFIYNGKGIAKRGQLSFWFLFMKHAFVRYDDPLDNIAKI